MALAAALAASLMRRPNPRLVAGDQGSVQERGAEIALEAASPGLRSQPGAWSLAACAEPLAEATGVKLVVTPWAPLTAGLFPGAEATARHSSPTVHEP